MKSAALLVALLLPSATASAQHCPVVDGLVATISTGDSTRAGGARDTARTLLRFDSRTVFDTVWQFNISERRWTRPYIAASVGAGWAGGASTRGMTTAPDAREWSVCASAAVGMRNPTIVLRGARGLVRLRADLTSLTRAGRGARADSSQPRR